MNKGFIPKLLFAATTLLVVGVLVRTAWIGDDAYITFRTIDNFANGYGLTWNTIERVQAYTHPLWMFLLSILYFVTGEIYLTSIITSIVIVLAAVIIYGLKIADSWHKAVMGIVFLMLTRAFVDYSTSGLENPLTFLIAAIFFWQFLKKEPSPKRTFILSLLASLAALNRLDTILIFFPSIVLILIEKPRWITVRAIIIGFLPFIVWEIFSLYYYGFPFPNTAYAKLNTGIDSSRLIDLGFNYILNGIKTNPLLGPVIFGAIIASLVKKSPKILMTGIGIILYMAYIIKIGGGFMSGRFLAVPFFISIIIFSNIDFPKRKMDMAVIYGSMLTIAIIWGTCPLFSGQDYGKGRERLEWDKGISNERAGYYQDTGLLKAKENNFEPDHTWVELGRQLKKEGDTVITHTGVGFAGYYAGPKVHIVDGHALTDPLLSRLPVTSLLGWRIGHNRRQIPEGYLTTLREGKNLIRDDDLSKYYDHLMLLTRGSLFSWSRTKEISKFNLGYYDHLIKKYLDKPLINVNYSDVNTPIASGTALNYGNCFILSESGINIHFPDTVDYNVIETSTDNNDRYVMIFRLDTVTIDSLVISGNRKTVSGLVVDTSYIPEKIAMHGYNLITVVPLGTDKMYGLGHLRALGELEKDPTQVYNLSGYSNFNFGEGLILKDLKIEYLNNPNILFHIEFAVEENIEENLRIFFHISAENSEVLLPPHASRGFINLDIRPHPPTSVWKPGDIYRFNRTTEMMDGVYKINLGFFGDNGRLENTYISRPFIIDW